MAPLHGLCMFWNFYSEAAKWEEAQSEKTISALNLESVRMSFLLHSVI
jgi:hypothetical protein